MSGEPAPNAEPALLRVGSDVPFYLCFGVIGSAYILLIAGMLLAEVGYTTPGDIVSTLSDPKVQYSIRLSLISCTITTILALWVSVPIGYLLSRHNFRGKAVVDAILDIPIILPPLVIGLCLLILFASPFAETVEGGLQAVERTLANNLVPVAWLTCMAMLTALFFWGTRQRISSRRTRILIPVLLSAVLFPLVAHRYLFPSPPDWMPTIAGYDQEKVTFRDQSPLRRSRSVCSIEYTATGSVEAVVNLLHVPLSQQPFISRNNVEQVGYDGLPDGRQLIVAEFAADADSQSPQSGELHFLLTPRKDESRIQQQSEQADGFEREIQTLKQQIVELRPRDFENTLLGFDENRDDARRLTDRGFNQLDELIAELDKEGVGESQQLELKSLQSRLDDLRIAITARTKTRGEQSADDQENLSKLFEELKAIRRQIDPNQPQIDAFQRRISELNAKLGRTREQIETLNNEWKTESVVWDIRADIVRRIDDSRADFIPFLTFPVTYEIPSVILAQFMVACAFAVRTMRVTFDQIDTRFESVALTLGCTRAQAFWQVVFPQTRRGLLAAGTLAWARALGEFGPILIFSGSTRMKTEVLPTTVFLEMTTGNIAGAVAASLVMIVAAMIVLIIARTFGLRKMGI
jgi:ABC-type sulfate transport system permease component